MIYLHMFTLQGIIQCYKPIVVLDLDKKNQD